MNRFGALICLLALAIPGSALALPGDARPDAPALAARGEFAVGVRTLQLLHRDQLEVLAISAAKPAPRYDRPLRVELWYPARLAEGEVQLTTYTDVLGAGANDPQRPNTPFQFDGRASRDAQPSAGRFPLVIVSHGYPGSRLQMSYLTEHLASHGYVVAAIDHTESTRADKGGFASTLLNRPLDDLFVLDQLAAMGAAGSGSFLAGKVDAQRSALIGYSMGAYGALNAAGAGVSAVASSLVPGQALQQRMAGNPAYEQASDARLKALVLFAPWGGRQGIFDGAGLAGLRVPSLFIAGDQDDVSGYGDGIRRLVDGAVNAERYLLVYQNARHNVAPNPPPAAASSHPDDFAAYAEPAWDSTRINNINQHFVLAFLDRYLKGADRQAYLELLPQAGEGKWALDASGAEQPEHSHWHGFPKRSAVGLEWHHFPAATAVP